MMMQGIKRLFNSVFTRLLAAILVAGLAITFTVIVGFIVMRFHTESAFDRNLRLYADYLIADLGDPPDEARARQIAALTGLVIGFDHPVDAWQTGPEPRFFNPKRAFVRRDPSGLWMGSSKGHHFFRRSHGGGELTFIAPRGFSAHDGHSNRVPIVMALAMATILAGAYLYLRSILKPLRALKEGVDRVGDGRLHHRIPASGRGELRDLAGAFNAMADRLSRLLRSKERLLLDVSHELRSPITRLKVQLEFLTDAEMRESLRGDVAEMEAMVTALLESARLRHTAEALNRETIDLEALIRRLVSDFEDRPPGVVLGPMVADAVRLDPEKIRIVLRNLLDNAVKHTPDDGPAVSIAMALKKDGVEVIVEDKGEGIPASALPHLFEPFYRPDVSRSRKTGGYGLGLSLCKAIVDAHGGRIEVSSTLGQGTRVTVTIPRQ